MMSEMGFGARIRVSNFAIFYYR